MYGLIWLTDLRSKMDSVDLLIMLTSAVCHDLDHTGYNNAYQVKKKKNEETQRYWFNVIFMIQLMFVWLLC